MTLLKKPLLLFFLLLLAAVVGVAGYLQTIDWNQYRSTISAFIAENSEYELDINGSVSFELFPAPSVKASDIVLRSEEESDSGSPFLSADALNIRLSIANALTGTLRAEEIIVSGLEVRASDVLTMDETTASEGNQLSLLAELDRLNIVDSLVTVDAPNGATKSIKVNRFSLAGRLGIDPTEISGAVVIDSAPMEFDLFIQPTLNQNAVSMRGKVAVSGGTLEVTGRLGGKGSSARISASGDNTGRFLGAISQLTPYPLTGDAVIPFEFDASVTHKPIEEIGSVEFQDTIGGTYEVTLRKVQLGSSLSRADIILSFDPTINKLTLSGGADAALLVPADLAAVRVAQSKDTFVASQTEEMPLKLGGGVDLTIAALQLGAERVRQITTRLDFEDPKIVFNTEALLPGATKVEASGAIHRFDTQETRAEISAQTGQLQSLLSWTSIPERTIQLFDNASTASFAGVLSFGPSNDWQLANLKGRLDSSSFEGVVRGLLSTPVPTGIALSFDRFSLPAREASDFSTTSEATISTSTDYCVHPSCWAEEIGGSTEIDLFFGLLSSPEFSLENTSVTATLSENGVAMRDIAARLKLLNAAPVDLVIPKATLSRQQTGWEIDALLSVDRLPRELIIQSTLIPSEKPKYLKASLSLIGPLEDISVSSLVEALEENESERYQVAGELSWTPQSLAVIDIQGSLTSPDIYPFLPSFRAREALERPTRIPAELTLSSSPVNSGISVKVSGRILGIQSQFSATYFKPLGFSGTSLRSDDSNISFASVERPDDLSLNFDASKMEFLETLFGLPFVGFQKEAPASADARIEIGRGQNANSISLSRLRVSQSDRFLEGALTVNLKSKEAAGRLKASGLDFASTSFTPKKETIQSDSENPALFVSEWTGQVTLEAAAIGLLGQVVSFPPTQATLAKGDFRLTLDNATLNGDKMSADLLLSLLEGRETSLKLAADTLQVTGLLQSLGYPPVLSAEGAVSFSLSGPGAVKSGWLCGATGEGKADLAGGNLTLVDGQAMAELFQRSLSETDFIRGLPRLLAGGSSTLTEADVQFRMEKGVLLLDELEAKGGWGQVSADGQVNLPANFLRLAGTLEISPNKGLPVIPLAIEGPLQAPRVAFDTGTFLSVGRLILQQRAMADLRQRVGSTTPVNPLSLMLDTALSALKKAQTKRTNRAPGSPERR